MYIEDERDTTQWLPWDNSYRKQVVVYYPSEIKTPIEYNNIYDNNMYEFEPEDYDDEYVEETSEEEEMNAELLDNREYAYT